MKHFLIISAALVGFAAAPATAGCLTGAAVGGTAGHFAGHHAILGAAAGCAYGHHRAVVAKRQAEAARRAGTGTSRGSPTGTRP